MPFASSSQNISSFLSVCLPWADLQPDNLRSWVNSLSPCTGCSNTGGSLRQVIDKLKTSEPLVSSAPSSTSAAAAQQMQRTWRNATAQSNLPGFPGGKSRSCPMVSPSGKDNRFQGYEIAPALQVSSPKVSLCKARGVGKEVQVLFLALS